MSVTARRRQVCWQGHLAPGLMYILFFLPGRDIHVKAAALAPEHLAAGTL